MSDDESQRSEAFEAAMERRIELKEALSQVELAAAAPAGDPSWRANLLTELDDLRVALDQHVTEVESDDGLLAELTRTAPRLVNQVGRVQAEHPPLQRQMADTIARVGGLEDIDAARTDVLDLLVAIARHRQKGADLVYEASSVDIGGG